MHSKPHSSQAPKGSTCVTPDDNGSRSSRWRPETSPTPTNLPGTGDPALLPISMTLPLTLLLLAFFATTCIRAQSATPAPRTMQIYTGNEAPVCFDTNTYRRRQIDPYPILQFLGARCTETTHLTATRGLFRYKDAHQHYPEYDLLPIDIYFQPATACLEDIYHLNSGSAKYHITLPMRYEGTYYVVIRDQTKPSVLIVNSVTLEAEFRRCCALTESIIPNYLNR